MNGPYRAYDALTASTWRGIARLQRLVLDQAGPPAFEEHYRVLLGPEHEPPATLALWRPGRHGEAFGCGVQVSPRLRTPVVAPGGDALEAFINAASLYRLFFHVEHWSCDPSGPEIIANVDPAEPWFVVGDLPLAREVWPVRIGWPYAVSPEEWACAGDLGDGWRDVVVRGIGPLQALSNWGRLLERTYLHGAPPRPEWRHR